MSRLSKINTSLLLLIIVVNSYVILTPVTPFIALYLPSHAAKQQELSKKVHASAPRTAAPQPNSVIIPAMALEQPVLEGRDTYKVLNQGILRWPSSSTPDKGGNTVLLGHRFTYHQPKGALYYLDRVKTGDEIGMVWDNTRYTYRVSEVKIVKPTATEILAGSSKPRLTIFTCTPLLWPKDRLVVVAEQISPKPVSGTTTKEPAQ